MRAVELLSVLRPNETCRLTGINAELIRPVDDESERDWLVSFLGHLAGKNTWDSRIRDSLASEDAELALRLSARAFENGVAISDECARSLDQAWQGVCQDHRERLIGLLEALGSLKPDTETMRERITIYREEAQSLELSSSRPLDEKAVQAAFDQRARMQELGVSVDALCAELERENEARRAGVFQFGELAFLRIMKRLDANATPPTDSPDAELLRVIPELVLRERSDLLDQLSDENVQLDAPLLRQELSAYLQASSPRTSRPTLRLKARTHETPAAPDRLRPNTQLYVESIEVAENGLKGPSELDELVRTAALASDRSTGARLLVGVARATSDPHLRKAAFGQGLLELGTAQLEQGRTTYLKDTFLDSFECLLDASQFVDEERIDDAAIGLIATLASPIYRRERGEVPASNWLREPQSLLGWLVAGGNARVIAKAWGDVRNLQHAGRFLDIVRRHTDRFADIARACAAEVLTFANMRRNADDALARIAELLESASPTRELLRCLEEIAQELGGLAGSQPGPEIGAVLDRKATELTGHLEALEIHPNVPVHEILETLPQLLRGFRSGKTSDSKPRVSMSPLVTTLRPEERSDDIELSVLLRNTEEGGVARNASVQLYGLGDDPTLRPTFEAGERQQLQDLGDLQPGKLGEAVFRMDLPANLVGRATSIRLRGETKDDSGSILASETFSLQIVPGSRESANSPYTPGEKVTGPSFIGREKELKMVIDALIGNSSRTCAVVGTRRIGKTSLLFKICDDAEVLRKYHPVYVDLEDRTNDTTVGFLLYLAEKTCDRLPPEFRNSIEFRREDFRQEPYLAFERFTESVSEVAAKRRKRVLLILDELETIVDAVKRGSSDEGDLRSTNPNEVLEPQVFGALRKVIMKNDGGLRMVFAGLPRILEAKYEDRLFGLLTRVPIGAFSERAATEIIDASKTWFTYSSYARDLVFKKSGFQPYLLQLICHHVFARMVESGRDQVTPNDVDTVIRTDILPQESYFVDYKDLIGDDRPVLSAMARLQKEVAERRQFVSVSEIAQECRRSGWTLTVEEITKRLQAMESGDRPLVRRAPNAAGRFQLLIGILGDWLVYEKQ